MKNRILVGLTGGYASGKSTVLKILKKLGAFTIGSDEIVHDLLKNDRRIISNISKAFGDGYLNARGEVDRRKLAGAVFHDKKKLAILEKLIHPVVKKKLVRLMGKSRKRVVVADIPLLFEKKWENMFDFTLTVCCSKKEQLRRASARDKISGSEALHRIGLQMPLHKKVLRSDYIVNTDKNTDLVKVQTELVYEEINRRLKK